MSTLPPDTTQPRRRVVRILEGSLVILCGVSGSGKTHWAQRHFNPSEVLSSDSFRERLTGDENDQTATRDAFYLVRWIALRRLRRGLTTVIDATALTPVARKKWRKLAQAAARPAVLVVFDVPEAACIVNNRARHRDVGEATVHAQREIFEKALIAIARERYDAVQIMTPDDATNAVIVRDAARPLQ